MSLFGYHGTPAGEAAYDMMVLNDIAEQETSEEEDEEDDDELYARD